MCAFGSLYYKTPLLPSYPLKRTTGKEIYLKLENLQPSGSFKNRGIGFLCRHHLKEGCRHFVSSSGGNAGLAAAFACRQLNVKITVVLPETTPPFMREMIEAEKAEVIVHGADWNAADSLAQKICREQEGCYVPPFDDPHIWEGNSTMIDEIARTEVRPDAVVLAVGGGGLLTGVVQGLKRAGWGDIPVFAAEPEGAASYAAAIKAGKTVAIERVDTAARSLGARRVADKALECYREHPIRSKVISDRAATEACKKFRRDHRMLVEPACGVALSLCYDKDPDLMAFETIAAIVCGGCIVS